ncbi:endo-beta-1,3-1,4 glucanase [alpha proteobacterium U9-1i]|nr:endo-beta-1,3-1,4 glucanase [alpha proteobacterium U9-1i]
MYLRLEPNRLKRSELIAFMAMLTGFCIALAIYSPNTRLRGQEITQPAWDSIGARPAFERIGETGFVERFRALDEGVWRVADGWSNGAWTSTEWRRSQAILTAEGLTLTLAPSPEGADKPYMAGEIATHEAYVGGYFETRMRVPRGEGLVTGFFTFTRPDGRGTWEELDVEILGRDTRRAELTYHLNGRARREIVQLPFDAADGFHTYAIEWREDAIRWYIDNELAHEVIGRVPGRFDRPQQMFVHLWTSDALWGWVGSIHDEEAPWVLTVDCVARSETYEGRALCGD